MFHLRSRATRVVPAVAALALTLTGVLSTGSGADATPATSYAASTAHHARPLPTHAAARATLNRVHAVFDGTRNGRPNRSAPDATMLLRDLRIAYPRLSPAEQQTADRYLSRPGANGAATDEPVYNGPEHAVCNTALCVHYVLASDDPNDGVSAADANANSIPDYVEQVLATVSQVRGTYQTAGYRMPLDDSTSDDNGGDGRTDIYLGELGDQGLYGYCTSDDPGLASVYYGSAYCVLDNNYSHAEFPVHTALQNLQVTAAHEFFHAVQFSYDFYEDSWIMEATATWAEDELYDSVNDNVQYLANSPLTRPGTPLDVDGMHWYGTWIFFRYLTENTVTARDANGTMPVLVREIWQHLDANLEANPNAIDQYSIQGVAGALSKEHDKSLTSVLTWFDVAARHPARYYSEASANDYPTAALTKSTAVGPGHLTAKRSFTMKHLTYQVLRFSPKAGMGSAWHLRLVLNLPDVARGSSAAIWVTKHNGSVSKKLVSLSRTGAATIRLGFASSAVRNVEVTVVNASRRFQCWTGAGASGHVYSCLSAGGRDDGTTQVVTATAYRS